MSARTSRVQLWLFAVTVALGCSKVAKAFAQSADADRTVSSGEPPAADAKTEEIRLAVGEQFVLPSENVRSYSEGRRGIVDVRLTQDASRFILVALKPGETTLLLLMMDGTQVHHKITVYDPNAEPEPEPVEPVRADLVEARDNIRLDFYFVQLTKGYDHQIGIGYPGSIAPTFSASYDVAAGSLDSATAVISNLALPRLDMAQGSGWAKVLRQAAVVTANREKAVFSGGGEVNISVQGSLTTGVHKIPFGSLIEVQPRYDAETGRIELRLHADISSLEDDRGTGVPGRSQSTLDTVVNLELGQSIILAGLSAKGERRSTSGLPGLSQIPLLGILFGSHAQSEEESESVIVIVPSVVDAVSMLNRERIRESLRHYMNYSGQLDTVQLVPNAPAPKPRSRP